MRLYIYTCEPDAVPAVKAGMYIAFKMAIAWEILRE